MKFEDLTEEQKAKVVGKSPEEILALAKDEGSLLSEEELDQLSGSGFREMWVADTKTITCPKCRVIIHVAIKPGKTEYMCTVCHRKFKYPYTQ